jgi:hypothetical protein
MGIDFGTTLVSYARRAIEPLFQYIRTADKQPLQSATHLVVPAGSDVPVTAKVRLRNLEVESQSWYEG